MNHEKKYNDLIDLIGSMPEDTPSDGFTGNVLDSLQPKKLAWWKKLYRMAVTTQTVSFKPIRLVPVAALCIGLMIVMSDKDDPSFPTKKNEIPVNVVKQIPITFELKGIPAEKVSVIGSFNQWNSDIHEMRIDPEKKVWILKLMLPPGRHEYAFLIDGKKVVPDPNAVFNRKDGFGSYNSVIFANPQNEKYL